MSETAISRFSRNQIRKLSIVSDFQKQADHGYRFVAWIDPDWVLEGNQYWREALFEKTESEAP